MPSTLQIDTIKDASASNTLFEQSGSDWKWGSGVPEGTVLQVQNDILQGIDSFATVGAGGAVNAAWQNSSLSIAITPKQTGSKMFITTNLRASWDLADASIGVKITRHPAGGSEADVAVGTDTGSNRIAANANIYLGVLGSALEIGTQLLDAGTVTAGTAITYRVKCRSMDNPGSISLYLNRGESAYGDANYVGTSTSSLTIFEVAQ